MSLTECEECSGRGKLERMAIGQRYADQDEPEWILAECDACDGEGRVMIEGDDETLP